MRANIYKPCIFLLFFVLLTQLIVAQNSVSKKKNKPQKSFLNDERKWTIEVPVWIPGFRGDFTYGEVSLEGEDGVIPENPIEKPDAGNIFNRLFKTSGSLNFFFMNKISYHNQKFFSEFDAFSGSVGGKIKFRYNNKELVQAKFSTYLFRIYAGYQLYEKRSVSENWNYKLYGYGGVRIHSVNVKSKLNGIDRKLKVTPLWSEPILGIKNDFSLKNWQFVLAGDVGHFNIDGKISYMINVCSYYRISNLLSVKAGWIDWDIKYKDSYKDEALKLKMHLSGPIAAIVFHF